MFDSNAWPLLGSRRRINWRWLASPDQTTGGTFVTPGTSATSAPSIADDPNWHFTSLSYIWFPGISGTVGAKGYSKRVSVSPVDMLKHFNIGLMGSFSPVRTV